jgi:hypothetical protein
MWNVLPFIIAANMIVAHKQAGLGSNFFPSSSLGTTIAISAMTTTIAAEDFSSGGAVEPGVRDKLDLGRWPFF